MFEGAEPERGAGLSAVFAGAAAPRLSAASAEADSDRREARPEVQVFKHALALRLRSRHIFFDVSHRAADFFARIEDIFGVENVLRFGEKCEHFGAVHQIEIRCADNAVVVLPRYRAFVFRDELVDERCELHDGFAVGGIREVYERNDMEIRIADVPRYRMPQAAPREKLVQLSNEIPKIQCANDNV